MLPQSVLELAPALGLLAACRKSAKIRLALNWKPEPEFGGFYAAPYRKARSGRGDFAGRGGNADGADGGRGIGRVRNRRGG